MAENERGARKLECVEAGREVRLGPQGRLVLPLEVCRAAGISEGDALELDVDSEGTVTMRVAQRELWERARRAVREAVGDRDLVGELIQERRRDAEREQGGE